MTVKYYAGWDFASLGAFQLRVNSGPALDVNFTTGRYSHVSLSTLLSDYTKFEDALETAIEAVTGEAWTVTFADGAYGISRVAGNSTLSFAATDEGRLAADLLGFSRVYSATASAHISSRRPLRIAIPVYDKTSDDSNTYEQSGMIAEAVASDGTQYSVHPVTIPTLRDWMQPLEIKTPPAARATAGTAVRVVDAWSGATSAGATIPESWESWFKGVRATHPFCVVDGSGNSGNVYKLRADAAHFAPIRRVSNYDIYWDIPLKTRLLGSV